MKKRKWVRQGMKYYLGVDLGGTNIVAGVVDENCKIIAKHSAPANAHRPFEEVVAAIATTAHDAAEKASLCMGDIAYVGIGAPGSVNQKTNLLVNSNNFGWKNVPFHDELKKHFDLPFFVDNDASCAALGEAFAGAARDYSNAVMMTLGTGVGGGIIVNKRIFRGGDHLAEFSHFAFVFDGELCTCGLRGCLEAYASATALINQTREAIKKHPESLLCELCGNDLNCVEAKTAFDAMARDDQVAAQVVDRYISYVAGGVGSFITMFRPEVFIIGGGVSNAGDALLRPLAEKAAKAVFASDEVGIPPIVLAELGNDAGIIGAAMLGRME